MTYYEILGVSENASQEEIRAAYKTLIKKYHPDIYQGDKSFAEKKSKEINEAYDTLSDSTKKTKYDLELHPVYTSYNYDEPHYNYTPPKYNNYNYNNYADRYSSQNTYDYEKRYTDYHRSKTPNSNYSNNKNSDFFYNAYNASSNKLALNVGIVLLILFIYFMIVAGTLFQYYNSDSEDGLSGSTIKTPTQEFQTHTNENENEIEDEDVDDDFDINDYYSDSLLREYYYRYYSNQFDSFSEFKEFVSKAYKKYYYNN